MQSTTRAPGCQCRTCKRIKILQYKIDHAKNLLENGRGGFLSLSLYDGAGRVQTIHIDAGDDDGLNEAIETLEEEIEQAVAYIDRHGHRRRKRFIPLRV